MRLTPSHTKGARHPSLHANVSQPPPCAHTDPRSTTKKYPISQNVCIWDTRTQIANTRPPPLPRTPKPCLCADVIQNDLTSSAPDALLLLCPFWFSSSPSLPIPSHPHLPSLHWPRQHAIANRSRTHAQPCLLCPTEAVCGLSFSLSLSLSLGTPILFVFFYLHTNSSHLFLAPTIVHFPSPAFLHAALTTKNGVCIQIAIKNKLKSN